ncbi:MAG: hypothetical protein IT530_14475 [Burkholderiales bacterium]|nr:hypothetical protein [Burkholderiales bacterium]
MRYLWVGLLVTSIASLEFLHELGSGTFGGSVCSAPEVRQDVMREALFQHLKSH